MRAGIAAGLIVVAAALRAQQGQPGPERPPAAIAQLAAKAAAAREADNLPEALKLYRQAVTLAPKWAEGWWYLGTMQYDKDQYAGCRDAFRQFVAINAKIVPAFSLLGLCEFQTKEFPKSLAHLEKAIAMGLPEGEDLTRVTMYHAALLHAKAQNFERALRLCAMVTRFAPNDAGIIAVMGIAQLRRPVFPQEVAVEDREMVMMLGRAFGYQSERRVAEAIAAYEEVVGKYPNVSSIHYAFGTVLLTTSPERGAEMLIAELKITPNHIPALVSLAAYYLKRGMGPDGLPYAERAAKAGPRDFAARATYGRLLVETEKLAKGILELEAARTLAPDSPEVRFSLGSAYGKAGRTAEANREKAEFARLKKLFNPSGGQETH
ncbi:MAG: tetratricopeptide repeat protein [Bryobacterales bacterium]|nr:tetratricopeptide repeat protein [Bryobacterales bacterium]